MSEKSAKDWTANAIFVRQLIYFSLFVALLLIACAGLARVGTTHSALNLLYGVWFMGFGIPAIFSQMKWLESLGLSRTANIHTLRAAEKTARASGPEGLKSLQALLQEYPEPTVGQMFWWKDKQPDCSSKARAKNAAVRKILAFSP